MPGDGLAPRGGRRRLAALRAAKPKGAGAKGPCALCVRFAHPPPPPRGQANAALPVVGRIGFTKQNSEPHSVWLAEGEQGA